APTAGQPGLSVIVTWAVANQGPGLAKGPWVDRVYLSSAGTVPGATLLATVQHAADLAGGATYTASATFGLPSAADGAYHVVAVTDDANSVFEGNGEGNNQRAADGLLQMTHADLVPAITAAPAAATSGDTVSVSWSVTNAGTADALG